jgi:hypothetical protein
MQYTRLANTWPWNKEWIAFMFWIPGLVGVILTYIAKSKFGNMAYWLLGVSVWGFLFAFIYAYVSNKVRAKLNLLKNLGLEPTDGIIAFGKLQAPAAIALTPDTLHIAAIVGKEFEYSLKDLRSASIDSLMPGKKFFFKKVFHLTFTEDRNIAFAIKQVFVDDMKTIFDTVLKQNKKISDT